MKHTHSSETQPTLICAICGADTEVFFEVQNVPICCNVLWPTREAAMSCDRAEIRLAFCQECGYIYNAAFDPEQIVYDAHYDNSLHFSAHFQEYAQRLATYLIDVYALHGKTIIEIGCGNAEFLSLLCELGPNHGIGFDPSFIAGRADLKAGKGIEIVADAYSERYVDGRSCDLLCSRHMLEHIPNPRAIIGTVKRALKHNPLAAVYFEVPNVLFTLREKGVWDLIYEHCSYFAPQSFYRLFTDAGFQIQRIRESFEGQYLSLEAVVSNGGEYIPAKSGMDLLRADVSGFSAYRARLVEDWKTQLDHMHRTNQRIGVWGAGSKGTTFLNTLGERKLVQYVVDINPHKQGKYIPGTGQEIISPETLREVRPDVLILTNPIYRHEVEQTLAKIGVRAKIITCPYE